MSNGLWGQIRHSLLPVTTKIKINKKKTISIQKGAYSSWHLFHWFIFICLKNFFTSVNQNPTIAKTVKKLETIQGTLHFSFILQISLQLLRSNIAHLLPYCAKNLQNVCCKNVTDLNMIPCPQIKLK